MGTYGGLVNVCLFLSILHCSLAFWDADQDTCVGSTMNKLMFNQTGYVQFIYLGVDVPDLSSFHTCFWFSLLNPERRATLVHYAHDDASRTNKLNIEWTGTRRPTWKMVINQVEIGAIDAPVIQKETWHHVCITWDLASQEFVAFQDGNIIGEAKTSQTQGIVIPGKGGLFAIGQDHPSILQGGMDQGAGMEGFITLFHFDSRSIPYPSTREAQKKVKSLYSDCSAKDRGNIVGWLRTHRKGYGGVTEIFAKERCDDDASRTNKLNIEWTGTRRPTWKMVINQVEIGAIDAPVIQKETWHHVCITWDLASQEFVAFQDGNIIGEAKTSQTQGIVIPGKGGLFAIGQDHPSILQGGMDQGAGMEGFITLFHFDSRSIPYPSTREAQKKVKSLYSDCSAKDRGNIVGWLRTHRKGYGGVTEIFAKERCGSF